MGTNYYLVDKETNKRKHIGKNSYGWVFTFSTECGETPAKRQQNINNTGDYFIENEYGEVVDVNDMWDIITSQKDTGQRMTACTTRIEGGYMVISCDFC